MSEKRRRGFLVKPEGLALIEQKMAEKGYTSQEQLAEAAGLSLDTINRLFRGERIQRKSIGAIATALDLKPTDLVEESEWRPASSTATREKTVASEIDINWRGLCRVMIERQQDTQRLRRRATEIGFEVNVHVPLGLVERKWQQRRSGDIELEQVYRLTQESVTKTYEHNQFLAEVIGRSQAKTNKHIAIVGEPGAGKTTLLSAIASFIKSKTQNLPICISLASLQGRTLEDYLLKEWLPEAMGLFKPGITITSAIEDELIEQFRQGRVWLLLDGVDEMGIDSPIQALATIQKQLINWIGQAQVVLTCRVNVWDASTNNILTDFNTYKSQEFNQQQVNEFIQEWFACAEKPQKGEELQAKLSETVRERIRQLVRNPLRLSLLCQTYYLDGQGELPETKAALYERFTRYFYEWKQNLYTVDLTTQNELHKALGKLALVGIDSQTRFRLRQSLACQEMGEQLFRLAETLGWLNLVDRDTKTDEPVYAFLHPLFQEYFAALAVEDWDYFLPRSHDNQNPQPVREAYRIFASQWKEVILLWLGREDVSNLEKEDFLKALMEFNDNCNSFYRCQAFCLTASGISEFIDFSQSDKAVEKIVQLSFGYFDEEKHVWMRFADWISEEAKKVLKETNREKLITNLIRIIQNFQPEKIGEYGIIAHCLGEIDPGNPTAIDLLIQLICTTKNKFTLGQAIESLGKIGQGNPVAINLLIQLVNTTQDKSILRKAMESLEKNDPGNKLIKNLSKIRLSNRLGEQLYLQLLRTNHDYFIFFAEKSQRLRNYGFKSFTTCNEISIVSLIRIESSSLEEDKWQHHFKNLMKKYPENKAEIAILDRLIQACIERSLTGDELTNWSAEENYRTALCEFKDSEVVWKFIQILQADQLPEIVAVLKTQEIYSDYFLKKRIQQKEFNHIFWHCAQNMSYLDFYHAWYDRNSRGVQFLENQFTDIASQPESTNITYSIVINALAMEEETDTSAIAQELCNQIYLAAFTNESEIPEVSNAPQLKRLIPKVKKQLQKQNIALILDKSEPNQEQIAFCRKLSDVLHIAWITNQPLEAPLKGFPANQPNLSSIIQNWINEIE